MALFGIIFGMKTYGQSNPCNVSPYYYMGLEFYNVTFSGGTVCFLDTCGGQPSSWCCYSIPNGAGSNTLGSVWTVIQTAPVII